jgi:hypothetical protein
MNASDAKFWKLLIDSFVVSLLCLFGPFILNLGGYANFILIVFPLCIAWFLVVAYAFQQFKKRALWFLLGAPIPLYWVLAFVLTWLGIARM